MNGSRLAHLQKIAHRKPIIVLSRGISLGPWITFYFHSRRVLVSDAPVLYALRHAPRFGLPCLILVCYCRLLFGSFCTIIVFLVKFRVRIERDEDGVFVAEVPALPGCISQGETRDDALANAEEAIALYSESLEAHAAPIPPSITERRSTC